MRVFLSLLITVMSFNSSAFDMDCQWLKSSKHSEGFYRPADFNFSVVDNTLSLRKDTFLFRTYTPCWTGNFSSCAFGFTYDTDSVWKIGEMTERSMTLSAPGFYWSAELKIQFEVDVMALQDGDQFLMTLSGDDGDGVIFNNEKFSCLKLN